MKSEVVCQLEDDSISFIPTIHVTGEHFYCKIFLEAFDQVGERERKRTMRVGPKVLFSGSHLFFIYGNSGVWYPL